MSGPRLMLRTNLAERASRALSLSAREQPQRSVGQDREEHIIRRNPRLPEAQIRAKRAETMVNGPLRVFIARLLQLDTSEPFEFVYGDKLITITIEDLPDAD